MDIKDYEDYYTISRDGKVWSKKKERYLKPGKRRGYLYVTLWKNVKGKKFSIHRLVALNYIENPEGKPTVDHKDRDILNNSVNNLRWATRAEQQRNKKTFSNTGFKYISKTINKGKEYYLVQKTKVFGYHLMCDKWTLEEAVEIRDCLCKRHDVPLLDWID